MLGANVKIADKAEVQGEEGVEAGGWRLQHGDNVYGPGLAFADSMRCCHYVPHACTPATSLSDAATHSRAAGYVPRGVLPPTPTLPYHTAKVAHSFIVVVMQSQLHLKACSVCIAVTPLQKLNNAMPLAWYKY